MRINKKIKIIHDIVYNKLFKTKWSSNVLVILNSLLFTKYIMNVNAIEFF